jgi:cyclic pyranopterin phosphate synthase
MIDITNKTSVKRKAIATGKIILKESTIQKIKNGEIEKGDPLVTAKIASINGVKQTQLLLPFCHPIPITSVNTEFKIHNHFIEVFVTVTAIAKTGVEMESLIGVTIALNTIWDMVKRLEKDENGQYPYTRIEGIRVLKKSK